MAGMQTRSVPVRQGESHSPQATFVGRTREISIFTELLDAARSGRGHVIALSGEPGIGKTRLAKRAVEVATSAGFRVSWGRCHEGQYVPAYGPWMQVVRGLLAAATSSRARSLLEALRVDPAPASTSGAVRPGPSPEQTRVRLIEAVMEALPVSCSRTPVMIVLDNLHCADTPSLDLLEDLAAEIAEWKLLVVLAYRPPAPGGSCPLAVTLGTLAGQDHFTPVRLGGLERDSVRAYLQALFGRSPLEAVVQAVHQRTEGNPLFVVEVTRLLGAEGLADQQPGGRGTDWQSRVPDRVLLAINGRIERLSAPCRDLLETAAVVGREFELPVLREIPGLAAESVDAGVEEALANFMIEEAPGEEGRYRFTHALVHDAVAARVASARRAGLRRAVGEALERHRGERAGGHAGELAPYFDSGLSATADKAVHYRARAGQNALSLCSFEDSLVQFGRALAICETTADERTKAGLFLGLARACHGLGDFARSVQHYVRAFELFVRGGDLRSALAGLAGPYLLGEGGPAVAGLLARAVELAGSRSAAAERVGFHYGLSLYYETGDAEKAYRVFEKARARARRDGDERLEAMILDNWSRVILDELDYAGARQMCEQTVALCVKLGERWTEATARSQLWEAFSGEGLLPQAGAQAVMFRRAAESMHSRFWSAFARNPVCLTCWQEADLRSMRLHLPSLPAAGMPVGHPWALLPGILYECACGNTEQCLALLGWLQRELSGPAGLPSWHHLASLLIPYLAWLSADPHLWEMAKGLPGPQLSAGRLVRKDAVRQGVGRAFVALREGDRSSAAGLYKDLLPLSGAVLSPTLGLTAGHILGLLATVAAEPREARRHFGSALEFCRKRGLKMELALTCLDFGCFLCDQGTPSDTETAAALHTEAGRIARAGGLAFLQHRLAELGRRIGTRGDAVPASSSGLSPRETEVLRLVAEGLGNEQIGERLFISPRTVANHVQRILEKTASANRTEAAVYAVRRGLAGIPGPDR